MKPSYLKKNVFTKLVLEQKMLKMDSQRSEHVSYMDFVYDGA